MNLKKKEISGYMNLVFCILLWASIPVATKKMLVELDNFQILFYSTALSTLVMGIIVLAKKKVKTMREYRAVDYRKMFTLGILGNFLYYIFLYGALDKTTASEGFILAYTWPMLVVVLSFFILKEKATMGKVLGILISFIGIIVITTKGDFMDFQLTNLLGDAMAVLGAVTFALFSVLGKKQNYDKTVSVFVFFLAAFICLIPTVLIFSDFVWPSSEVWKWLIYNGVFVNGISYVFWFKALERGKTHIVSNMLYLTPFISLVYIYFFLNEKILLSSFAGLVIIVFGILIQYLFKE